jgi:hypothetical protein
MSRLRYSVSPTARLYANMGVIADHLTMALDRLEAFAPDGFMPGEIAEVQEFIGSAVDVIQRTDKRLVPNYLRR